MALRQVAREQEAEACCKYNKGESMGTKKKLFRVEVAGCGGLFVVASSRQNAARRAFRWLIGAGKLKRQPKTDCDYESSWKDTFIECCNTTH